MAYIFCIRQYFPLAYSAYMNVTCVEILLLFSQCSNALTKHLVSKVLQSSYHKAGPRH